MFIETETTPNPATLKFLPGRTVMAEGTLDVRDPKAAEQSGLARALFSIDGVSGVFFGSDFVSVTKAEGEWQHLKPAILGAIMEHFTSGAPLLEASGHGSDTPDSDGEFFDPDDVDTVDTIKDLIESRVRPAVAGDGGDITFKGYRDGIVYLSMKGACSGCPSSTATLKHGIQNLLKHFVPSVQAVEQI
jgi:Fe-S cluster biogenesis protein NfuA